MVHDGVSKVFPAVKRVLIYRLGSLGDTLAALPALHRVARGFPNARRMMLTNMPVHAKAPAASAVLGDSGLIHGYLSYPVGTRSMKDLLAVWWRVARFRPEVVVYLAAPRGEAAIQRDRTFFRLCGAGSIVGLPEGTLAAHLLNATTGLWERESERLVRCLAGLGDIDASWAADWDLRLTDAELARGHDAFSSFQGAPFIACGPGTKMQAKDWGPENWRLLLERLSATMPSVGLVLVGAKEDRDVAAFAAQNWRGPLANLCGDLTPRETAAVLKDAACFLGPDSGPMHLAAAYGVPCVIAFASRTRPGIWFPAGDHNQIAFHWLSCSGCNLETCIEQQRRCLSSIAVDEMFAKTLEACKGRIPRMPAIHSL